VTIFIFGKRTSFLEEFPLSNLRLVDVVFNRLGESKGIVG